MARDRWIVSPQNSIELADSKPEPGLVLLRPEANEYANSSPQACHVLLLIEVADTSLAFDRDEKMSLYAEAVIPEYWIVDLIGEVIEVHQQPQPDGTYGTCTVYRQGDQIQILGGENDLVEVTRIL